MPDLGALDIRHGVATGTQQNASGTIYSDFNTVLLAAGVGFLLLVFDEENLLLLKYNHSRITQARDKQVEDKQDQSVKGCSHKELNTDNYQQ